jgi:signal transduction histidine kinase
MKIFILQKLFISSFIILIGNGLLGFAVYKSNQKLHNSEQWVMHTEKVIAQSTNILALTIDIETSSRGFVISNDSTFLEPLNTAEKTVFVCISQFKQLTNDNRKYQPRIDSLNLYMHKRLSFSHQVVEIRSKQGLAAAIVFSSTKLGKHYTDRIRQIITDIQQEETTLLTQRKQTNEHSLAVFNLFSVVMFVLMAIFTILLLIFIRNYWIENKEKEKRAAELIIINKELAFQNEEKIRQEVANKELEAFSYSVSHDLRAPLRHVSGYVDLLLKNNSSQLDEIGLRYLNTISESSHEMGNLIDALLSFSRLSRTELQRVKINSKNMVNRVLKSFGDELAGRNIEINQTELPDIMGDESLISLVWVNLISNALKYSRNQIKSVIDIGGNITDGKVIFYVKDNGVGFDMKYVDKLYGVFQRLHKVKDFEGIGIGLANVNRIVTRHGGKCWAEGKKGIGATFSFSIPTNSTH